ncbi:hypothetical protein B0H14DRAFT_2732396 [Mycena olivaceomarginata]|nr:hypothetical protein B0H14DRAFT_2732396 [Mycena olivaceomarginata]
MYRTRHNTFSPPPTSNDRIQHHRHQRRVSVLETRHGVRRQHSPCPYMGRTEHVEDSPEFGSRRVEVLADAEEIFGSAYVRTHPVKNFRTPGMNRTWCTPATQPFLLADSHNNLRGSPEFDSRCLIEKAEALFFVVVIPRTSRAFVCPCSTHITKSGWPLNGNYGTDLSARICSTLQRGAYESDTAYGTQPFSLRSLQPRNFGGRSEFDSRCPSMRAHIAFSSGFAGSGSEFWSVAGLLEPFFE